MKTVGQRLYRKPEEITLKINALIENYVNSHKNDISKDEKLIVDKVKEWDIKIDRQILEIFQNSITDEEFDELLEMSLHSIVELMIDQAKVDGIITPHEERIISYMSQKMLEKSIGGE